jgi:DNA-binding XRE family transcriptional regulator
MMGKKIIPRNITDDLEENLKYPEFAKAFGAAQAKSSLAITLMRARMHIGLTQKELASRAGVTQAYIAKLEGGEANPTLERIGTLLAVMGLTLTASTTKLSAYPNVSVSAEEWALGNVTLSDVGIVTSPEKMGSYGSQRVRRK